jgi:hypothetical protein
MRLDPTWTEERERGVGGRGRETHRKKMRNIHTARVRRTRREGESQTDKMRIIHMGESLEAQIPRERERERKDCSLQVS